MTARISILGAAERLFAEAGIEAVSLRQIASEAGQRNTSAVAYHFGSADNRHSGSADNRHSGSKGALVAALYEHRMTPVNARRLELLAALPDKDVRGYVRALVEPLAETLTEAEKAGRPSWYLRFLAEAMRYPDYDPGTVTLERPEAESIRELISGLAEATRPLRLAPGVFTERMRLLAILVITTLADRERRPDSGIGTETLIEAGTAIMSAPAHREHFEKE